VKPAVGYAKELLKLGQARGLLQFNATEISDKLTDTLNLEVSRFSDSLIWELGYFVSNWSSLSANRK